jgi:hypothetical protein
MLSMHVTKLAQAAQERIDRPLLGLGPDHFRGRRRGGEDPSRSWCLIAERRKIVRDSLHRVLAFLDRFLCPVKVEQAKVSQPRRHD